MRRIGILTALVLAAYFLIGYDQVCLACFNLKALSPDNARQYIQGFGSWAIVVYVLLYVANTFSPFFPWKRVKIALSVSIGFPPQIVGTFSV